MTNQVQKYSSENPNPIDKYVGGRIRERRILLGYSQEKVADALGISFQQVQKYENATNRIGASRLYDISKVLAVPVSFFYDDLKLKGEALSHDSETVEQTETLGLTAEKINSKESLKLLRYYYSISNNVLQQKAYDLIKAMSKEDFEDC